MSLWIKICNATFWSPRMCVSRFVLQTSPLSKHRIVFRSNENAFRTKIPVFTNCSRSLNFRYNNRGICTGRVFHAKAPFEINTNVQKDVLLFRYLNPKMFKVLHIFALCQFCFWLYLANCAFTMMKDIPVKEQLGDDIPFWRKVNLGEKKYRYGLTILSLLIAFTVVAATWAYTVKSVKYLILHKGGKSVTFITHGPFGQNFTRTVDLNKVSCLVSRDAAKVQLPIKVKGNRIHYVLDMSGEFTNPQLFDYTAGLKRNI